MIDISESGPSCREDTMLFGLINVIDPGYSISADDLK